MCSVFGRFNVTAPLQYFVASLPPPSHISLAPSLVGSKFIRTRKVTLAVDSVAPKDVICATVCINDRKFKQKFIIVET